MFTFLSLTSKFPPGNLSVCSRAPCTIWTTKHPAHTGSMILYEVCVSIFAVFCCCCAPLPLYLVRSLSLPLCLLFEPTGRSDSDGVLVARPCLGRGRFTEGKSRGGERGEGRCAVLFSSVLRLLNGPIFDNTVVGSPHPHQIFTPRIFPEFSRRSRLGLEFGRLGFGYK